MRPAKQPRTGRPRYMSADAQPYTFHVSAAVKRCAHIFLIASEDPRPLSVIVERLLERWTAGEIKLP